MSCPARLLTALGVLLLAGCAASGSDGDGLGAVAPLAARLPAQLADFQRVDDGQLATTPPSLVVRYRHPGTMTTATIFLRRGDDVSWPDGAESPQIQAEVLASTLAMVALLGNVPVARVPDYGLTPAGEQVPALRCTTVLAPLPQDAVRRETVCAAGLNGNLVKVHISGMHPRDRTEAAFRLFSSLALRVMFALREEAMPPPSGGNGPIYHL